MPKLEKHFREGHQGKDQLEPLLTTKTAGCFCLVIGNFDDATSEWTTIKHTGGSVAAGDVGDMHSIFYAPSSVPLAAVTHQIATLFTHRIKCRVSTTAGSVVILRSNYYTGD